MVACTPASPSSPTAAPATAPSPAPSAAPAKPAASPSASASPASTAAAPRPANAALHVTAPTAGQSLPAGTLQVTISYAGPTLVAAANATKLDDYHLHYLLDENVAPYLGTQVPVPAGNPHI